MPFMGQSEESKYIKRINQQLADVAALAGDTADNPALADWSRAVRESGLDYTYKDGRYTVRNTKENQAKVDQLDAKIREYSPKTVGDLRADAKRELEREAKQKAVEQYPQPKGEVSAKERRRIERQRKKYIKQYTARDKVTARVRENVRDWAIADKLEYLYQATGSHDIGARLSALSKGLAPSERDKQAIYDEFGRVTSIYRDYLEGRIEAKQVETSEQLEDTLNGMAFPTTGEVRTDGTLGASGKRKNRR